MNRPATRREVLNAYLGQRVRFATEYPGTSGWAKVRSVRGVPVVRLWGEDRELRATVFLLSFVPGAQFVSCPTIGEPRVFDQ